MAVILKYEIEGGDYYELQSPETHISHGWFEPHEKKSWHEDDKVVEVEYEPTDEEYAQQLAWYGLQGLTKEEQNKYREIAYRLAKAALEVMPELTEAIDKDEEFAVDLALEPKLEELE